MININIRKDFYFVTNVQKNHYVSEAPEDGIR